MRWWLLISLGLTMFLSSLSHGQQGNTVIIRYAGAPTGSCSIVAVAVNNATGAFYDCKAAVWNLVGGGGAGCAEGTCVVNAPAGNQTITGAHALNVDTGTFNTGLGLTYDSEFQPGATNAINFIGAVQSGTQQSALAVLGERPAGVHGEGLDALVNCTGTQSGGNGCVGIENDAYTSFNFTVNTPYLFGNAGFAEHDSPAGTVSTAMGSFLAVTNSRTGTAALNTGFYAQSQAGVSPTRNAAFYAVDQGTGASDYAIYIAGGKNNLGPQGTTVGSLLTTTNCSSAASPAVCAAAPAGSVVIAAGATTVVVNTTAVTANSQILVFPDETLGAKLSVTCNSTLATAAAGLAITARTAATSFTISTLATVAVNPVCLSYMIVN